MTEVMPESPMTIQGEEIKVKDGFEHLIKTLGISEQNVNIMKEWMAFQGSEDKHPPNSWISVQRPRWKDGQI